MFDNVGRIEDDDALARTVVAGLSTVALLLIAAGSVAVYSAVHLAQPAIELDQDPLALVWEPLVEEVEEMGVRAPPPPKLGGAPRTATAQDEPEPIAPVVAVDNPVLPKIAPIQNQVLPSIAALGPGVPNGDPKGSLLGAPCGEPGQPACGKVPTVGPSTVRVHHTQVKIRRKVLPTFPGEALDAGVQSANCVARVVIDERGRPASIDLERCPDVFRASARRALSGWRWYPARDANKQAMRAEFLININYRVRDRG